MAPVQVAVAPAASVAVHCTPVVPTGNCEPDGGTQLVATGGSPPEVVALNVTVTGAPSEDVAVIAGHVTDTGEMRGATPITSCDGALRFPTRS